MIIIFENLPLILEGVGKTLLITLLALIIGFLFSHFMVFINWVSRKKSKPLFDLYSFLLRGSPTLVQIFIVYYGLPQLPLVRETFLWKGFGNPFFCAFFTLGLNSCAYSYIFLQGSLNEIPRGEIEAGYSLGMSHWILYKRILLKRIMGLSYSYYQNEIVILLKGSSLASAITVLEFTGVTRKLMALSYDPVPIFVTTMILYNILAILLGYAFKQMGKKTFLKYQQEILCPSS